ncbi:MAG TPA: transposase [Candidatus Kerfeldbacteria bacterium]|nr:transposase [Candidatus Kerfeldbacteria bacterium]
MLYRDRYVVPSIRLKRWDDRSPGYYFVTICAKQRWTKPFGHIQHGYMCLSDIGTMAHRYWWDIPNHFQNVTLDKFVVMPDHVHGIIRINHNQMMSDHRSVETRHVASLQNADYDNRMFNKFGGLPKNSLSSIIHAYKSTITRWCNQNHQRFQWQPRYYEKIIRSHRELLHVRQYILNNPKKWYNDK